LATALLTLGLAAISASPASAAGANLYVDPAGTDAGNCQNAGTPCATVQYAVDQAGADDIINVAAGTYDEDVTVAVDLAFVGPNAGTPGDGARGTEAVIKTLRTTAAADVDIDGLAFDPQGDAAVLASTDALVAITGTASTSTVVNSVFTGAASFVPACDDPSATDCGMAHSAFRAFAGSVDFSDNLVQNFRYGARFNQSGAAALTATVTGNVVTGVSIQGIGIGGSAGTAQPGATVTGNSVSATGYLSSPAGVLLTNGGNTVTGNTFTDLGSGVYLDLCKQFDTTGNTVDDNVFSGAGVVIATSFNTVCQTGSGSDTEGSGTWVANGGEFTGFNANGNSFTGANSGIFSDSASRWSANAPVTTGPIDVQCNWWGDDSGPDTTGNPFGTGAPLVVSTGANQPAFDYEPWEIAENGACTGTAPDGPVVNLGYTQAVEPDSGSRAAFVPVFLSEPSPVPVTITFFTVGDTAVANSDFTVWGTPAAPRSITIPAGTLQTTINVPVRADADVESDEDFFVVVAGVSGGDVTLGNGAGVATILDSDVFGGANPVAAVTSGTIYEGNDGIRRAQFHIQLSRPVTGTYTVSYNTVDGSATAPGDYTTKIPGSVTFAATQINKTVDVQVPSNVAAGADREFFLQTTSSGGAAVDEINMTGTMFIIEDD
jgi:hypothetical protein